MAQSNSKKNLSLIRPTPQALGRAVYAHPRRVVRAVFLSVAEYEPAKESAPDLTKAPIDVPVQARLLGSSQETPSSSSTLLDHLTHATTRFGRLGDAVNAYKQTMKGGVAPLRTLRAVV